MKNNIRETCTQYFKSNTKKKIKFKRGDASKIKERYEKIV